MAQNTVKRWVYEDSYCKKIEEDQLQCSVHHRWRSTRCTEPVESQDLTANLGCSEHCGSHAPSRPVCAERATDDSHRCLLDRLADALHVLSGRSPRRAHGWRLLRRCSSEECHSAQGFQDEGTMNTQGPPRLLLRSSRTLTRNMIADFITGLGSGRCPHNQWRLVLPCGHSERILQCHGFQQL